MKTITLLSCLLAAVIIPAHAAQKTYPVKDDAFTRTLRSPTPEQLESKRSPMGVYRGSPKVQAEADWYADNFYNKLDAETVAYTHLTLPTHSCV